MSEIKDPPNKDKPTTLSREQFDRDPRSAMRLANEVGSVGIRDTNGEVRWHIVAQRHEIE